LNLSPDQARGGLSVASAVVSMPRFRPQVIATSLHFSFVAQCPPELAKAAPVLCTDPPGFDRATFHKELNAAVVAFFRMHLASGGKRL